MNIVYAKDGTVISQNGDHINCSNGETYTYNNKMLIGRGLTRACTTAGNSEAGHPALKSAGCFIP